MLKKLSLIFLILRGCSPSYAQVAINDTIVIPLATVSPIVNHKATLDLNPVIAASPVVVSQSNSLKTQGDSLKQCFGQLSGIATVAQQAQATANTTQSNLNTTNSTVASQGLKLTTQGNQITGISNQVATDGVNIAQNTADIKVLQQSSGGGGFVVPAPYNVTSSQNIPLLPYGTDIFVKCNGCTLTFNTVQQAGWKYTVHNIGTTTINFNANSLNKVNCLTKIANGQRPILVTYQTQNTIEIH